MSENQSQVINAMPAAIDTTPSKSRAPMLIEIPVNTRSPTSTSKAAQRLSQYPSPRKELTIDVLNERLQGAEQRREQITTKIQSNNQEKMEKVQKKQSEIEDSKKQAAAAAAEKIAKASANRENITTEKAKKAGQRVSHAKEVCSSIKKAEQAAYKNRLDAIENSQKAAAEKRESILSQTKQKAADHSEHVHDKIAQKGKETREKKAAIDQKLKDAEARRNVAEVSKTKTKKTVSPVVIEVDTTEIKVDTNTNAKARLESHANEVKKSNSLENVEEKLKGADERREQYMQQRISSPKKKKNAEKFQANREQLESEKKQAVEAAAKRVSEAEAKAKSINEEKAKKAAEKNQKVKSVMTAHQETEEASLKSKAEEIAAKQNAAEVRQKAQLEQRKNSAGSFNLKVGENAKVENGKRQEKKQAINQKMMDAEARRRVVETYKASPAKFRTTSPSSPTKSSAQPPAPPAFE